MAMYKEKKTVETITNSLQRHLSMHNATFCCASWEMWASNSAELEQAVGGVGLVGLLKRGKRTGYHGKERTIVEK